MIHLLPGAGSTVSALNAERVRLEVIAQNIANAHTTRAVDGKPYRRQEVCFQTALQQAGLEGPEALGGGPRVVKIRADLRPGQAVYQPGHPHADADGMLQLPNVNIHEEMADMIVASRSFEANLAVIRNSRQLATQTLALGRR